MSRACSGAGSTRTGSCSRPDPGAMPGARLSRPQRGHQPGRPCRSARNPADDAGPPDRPHGGGRLDRAPARTRPTAGRAALFLTAKARPILGRILERRERVARRSASPAFRAADGNPDRPAAAGARHLVATASPTARRRPSRRRSFRRAGAAPRPGSRKRFPRRSALPLRRWRPDGDDLHRRRSPGPRFPPRLRRARRVRRRPGRRARCASGCGCR